MEIDVTGVLLAGGKSRRMGEDKRYLVLGEQTLLERGLAVLRSIFQEVLVVIAQDSPLLDVDVRVVRDLVPECGSLGGLYTGLVQATTPYHLRGRMRHALSRSGSHCPVHKSKSRRRYCDGETRGRLHPMHALYGKRCLPVVEQMIRRRQLKIQEIVSQSSLLVRFVTEADLVAIDPTGRSFQNVNTPADLEVARSLLAKLPPPGQLKDSP